MSDESDLVPCVHCARHHAAKDASCPHCGKPVSPLPPARRSRRVFLAVALGLGGLAASVYAYRVKLARMFRATTNSLDVYGPPVPRNSEPPHVNTDFNLKNLGK